jgi:hypothetical protein
LNDPFELPSLEEIKEMEKAAIASIRIIAGIRRLSYEQEFINVAAHSYALQYNQLFHYLMYFCIK